MRGPSTEFQNRTDDKAQEAVEYRSYEPWQRLHVQRSTPSDRSKQTRYGEVRA